MKQAEKQSDIPRGPHYAILEFATHYVDYSSWGHGYSGGSSVPHTKYYFTENEEEWKAEIRKFTMRNDHNKFVALIVKGQPQIEVSINVGISHGKA